MSGFIKVGFTDHDDFSIEKFNQIMVIALQLRTLGFKELEVWFSPIAEQYKCEGKFEDKQFHLIYHVCRTQPIIFRANVMYDYQEETDHQKVPDMLVKMMKPKENQPCSKT